MPVTKIFHVRPRRFATVLLLGVAFAIAPFAGAAPPASQSSAAASPAQDPDTPLAWIFPTGPLRVHVVRGLWSREYRLEETLVRSGAAALSESWHTQQMSFGYVGGWDPRAAGSTPEFPPTPEALLQHHLLILCNVNALAFSPAQQKLIRDFVHQGGSLLLLGGRFAFGGQWNGTPLAEVTPATLVKEGFDLHMAENGMEIEPGPDRLGNALLPWQKSSRVFWYHDVTLKSGAHTLLSAGGHPLLITGTFGKGRVAMFAGTVLGEAPAGIVPFWADEQWPKILSQLVGWLSENRPQQSGVPGPALQAQLKQSLDSLATMNQTEADRALNKIEPLLKRIMTLPPDEKTAELVVGAVAGGDTDIPLALAERVGRWAGLSLGERGGSSAATLTASAQPGKVVIGLHLLGRARTENASKTLVRFLVSGKAAREAGRDLGADTLPPMGASMLTPAIEKSEAAYAIRRAALAGLADVGDPQTLPAIRDSIKQNAAGRIENVPGDQGVETYRISHETRLYQLGLLAALRCGDTSVAGDLAEALLGNIYVVARARSGWNGPKDSPEGELGYVLAWQSEMLDFVRRSPDGCVELLAEPLAKISDIRIVPVVCAAFGGRTLSAAAKAVLLKSTLKAVACRGE